VVFGPLNYGFVVEIFGFLFSIVHEFFHSSFWCDRGSSDKKYLGGQGRIPESLALATR